VPLERRRIGRFVLLAAGLGAAFYLGTLAPKTQHVRVVLGDGAPLVTGVTLAYLAENGEALREAELHWALGSAPRVVAHEPELPNGEVRLRIDLDAREGRRTVERRVTLGGGSTQVDVSRALVRDDKPEKPE